MFQNKLKYLGHGQLYGHEKGHGKKMMAMGKIFGHGPKLDQLWAMARISLPMARIYAHGQYLQNFRL